MGNLQRIYLKILLLFALVALVSVFFINDAFAQVEFISKFGTFGTGNGQFDQPWGIDVDNSGNIYVAEYWNHRIQKFDSSGNYITTFDNKGIYGYGCTNNPSNCNADGQLNQPMGISVDSSGNILVVDLGNQRIQKLDSSGNFIMSFGTQGSSDGQFYSPRDLAIDSSGNIWVADTNNNRIQKFDSSGNFLMKFGSYGQLTIQNDGTITSTDPLYGKFSGASSVAIDSLGNIYVGDANNRRIQKFDSSGNFLSQFGTYGTSDGKFIGGPNYVTIDNENRVYVSDRERHNVQIFDSNGNFITSFGTQGSSDGQFRDPKDIAIDSSGNIYVVDNNNRVQIFSSLAVTPPPDKIPPVIVVPNNMAIQATSNNPSPVTFSVSATDDKDGTVIPICSPKSGSTFPIGKTTVSCTANDKAGNTATKSFTVTITNVSAIDTDGDGITDSLDQCPTQDETVNGYDDLDGCPDVVPPTDTDGDGITDSLDQCITQPETFNGNDDLDGCPDGVAPKDTDKDGIPDSTDKCPTQKETVNGFKDTDGCPDKDEKKALEDKKLAEQKAKEAKKLAEKKALDAKKLADAKKALEDKKAEKIKLAKEKAKERAKEKAKK